MPRARAAFLKILPMLIVLACTGLFMWGIKAVIGVFYAPHDEVYYRTVGENEYTIVKCFQNPSSYFYIYNSDAFVYNEKDYENVAGEHNDAHLTKVPEVYFVLNETAPDVETTPSSSSAPATDSRCSSSGNSCCTAWRGSTACSLR